MQNQQAPEATYEQMKESLNQFSTLLIKPARMTGFFAEMEEAKYLGIGMEGMRPCIGWGDDPNEALINLYRLIKERTIYFGGKRYKLGKKDMWVRLSKDAPDEVPEDAE